MLVMMQQRGLRRIALAATIGRRTSHEAALLVLELQQDPNDRLVQPRRFQCSCRRLVFLVLKS